MNAQREAEIRAIGAWTSLQRENPLKVRDELIEEIDRLRGRIGTLFDKLKHGDEAHQAWLKSTIESHFA